MLFGQRLKKALALLLLISFVPATVMANPETGRFSRVLEGQHVSFDAWCFDDIATAKIQVTSEFEDERCKLRVNHALEKEKARYSLDIQNLNLRINSLILENNNILAIKDEEIRRLEEAALKRPNDYTLYWATGGFAAGAITVLAIVLATK